MKSSKIVRATLFLAAAVLGTLAATTSVQAAVVTNVSAPISMTLFIPCAGESVTLTGDLHFLFTVTIDNNGGLHLDMHFQPQGVTGTGSVTGDKYQGTGVSRFQVNAQAPFPFEITMVNNFRIIGQGTGNNFLVHATVHTTVDANGTLTAVVSNISVDCK